MIYEPKLALLIHIWDDPRGLTRIFEQKSTWDFDSIFIFDGKFSMYEGRQEFPDLEVFNITSDWAKTEPNTEMYYIYTEDITEAEKRSKGFWFAGRKEVDWAVVCDSDEYPEMDRVSFLEELKLLPTEDYSCYGVPFHHYEDVSVRPRLFYKPENHYLLQYENKLSHSNIYNAISKKEVTTEISLHDPVEYLRLYHNKSLRSKVRKAGMDVYRRIPNH